MAVETAKADLGYTRITAPMDGTVLAVVNQEGQTVNATQLAPTIVILGQLEEMIIRAEISEADVVNVRPGQKVYFNILGDTATRNEAALESIEPAPGSITSDSSVSSSSTSSSSSNSNTSSTAIYYNGVIPVDNSSGRFRTYMTAEVHIVRGVANDVLTVPASALRPGSKAGTASLHVIGDDAKVATRSVEIGLNDGVDAEVKSGLTEGETIVIGEANSSAKPTGSFLPQPGGM